MTTDEKIKYLIDKHNDEYLLKKEEVEANILNESYPYCCCGGLATKLHLKNCNKFKHKVSMIIARELSSLIPKKTRKRKGEK